MSGLDPRIAEVVGSMAPAAFDRLQRDLAAATQRHGIDPSDFGTMNAVLVHALETGNFSSSGIEDGLQQLAAAPYHQAQAPEPTAAPDEFGAQYLDQRHQDATDGQVQAQIGALERRLGRTLTVAEQGRLDEELASQVRQYGEFDADEAAKAVDIRAWSDMEDVDADHLMAEKIRDTSTADTSFEIDPASGRPVSDEDWARYQKARVLGHEIDYGEGI